MSSVRAKAVRAVTTVQAASLIEANEDLYTALSYGIALEQDLGDGRKSQQVRFFDFDAPIRNDLLVTRQYKVKGGKTDTNAAAAMRPMSSLPRNSSLDTWTQPFALQTSQLL